MQYIIKEDNFKDTILRIWLKSKKYSWITIVAYANNFDYWKFLMILAILYWLLINWLLI